MHRRNVEPEVEQAGDERGLFEVIVGDGRPLLSFTGLALVLAGVFALFLAATGISSRTTSGSWA